MNIAHARGGQQVSEKAIEKILTPEIIKVMGLSGENLKTILENAVITFPVGAAAQDSAICAIWVLGCRHEVLKPVAIQALTSLTSFKSNVATPYLNDLKQKYRDATLASSE
jgi:hypothetical protein